MKKRSPNDFLEGIQERIGVALLITNAVPMGTVLLHFREFVALHSEIHAYVVQNGMDRKPWETLDDSLSAIFELFMRDIRSSLLPFSLMGTQGRDVLFHILFAVVGRHLVPSKLKANVQSYCNACFHRHLASTDKELSKGLWRYMTEVANAYDVASLDRRNVREALAWRGHRCPVLLEEVHFPVILSDGHTYELETVVEMMRHSNPLTMTSPLTREPLVPQGIVNHALLHPSPLTSPRPRRVRMNDRPVSKKEAP